MIRIASQPKPAMPGWHVGFLAMLSAIRLHARISFRNLKPEAREEAVAECVANSLVAYTRLYQLGKVALAYPTVLARYAVAQVKDHRLVGGHLNIKDVSSGYCQRRKGVAVERLDKYDHEENCWEEVVIEDRHCGPFDVVRTKLDVRAWLRSLPIRQRRIAKFLANGETTTAASQKFGISAGRISQLRRELAENWKMFVGDRPAVA